MPMKRFFITIGVVLIVLIAGIGVLEYVLGDKMTEPHPTKVGCVLNGQCLDRSWVQSHYEGMEIAAQELNLEVVYKENVLPDESCVETMEDLIDDGCTIIMADSFDYGPYIKQVAEKHPEIYFFHATGVDEASNLSTYFGRIYQMRYLSGIVAGLQTKTNEVGYVAAFPISEVNRGINAFTLGARSVNPDVNVYVEWTYTWGEDEMVKEATEKLLNSRSIDVMTVHTDSLAAYEVADEAGVWIIGYNMDNAQLYPDTYLTAPVWNWEYFYEPKIKECLQGKFVGTHYWQGVDTGIVGLAPMTKNVADGVQTKVESVYQQMAEGTVDVFYGPIKDNHGNLRIGAGESMSDDAMLNDFSWFVEGVVMND